ncbi:MAG: glycoside hydrolase family 97 N-terminal domain-containing protein, partial [Duncaniella sp.]|nr:glycoside hydrolase family 97 N-terminal domain-containing protein [Duncaniella sp.]
MKNFLLTLSFLSGIAAQAAVGVSSPSGDISLTFDLEQGGAPVYSIDYKGKTIVAPSRMGLMADETAFTDGFTIAGVDTVTVDRTWQPVWGEYSDVRDHFRELAVKLKAENPSKEMTVRFRVFDDGVGFRYELPVQDGPNYLTLRDELTEYNLTADNKAYYIPGDYDTDEYLWSETAVSEIPEALAKYHKHTEAQRAEGKNIQTPMLMKTPDSVYVNIHEAALAGYPAMLLDVDAENHKLKTHLVPDRLGVSAYLQMPFNTPWRTFIISDDARDILASQLIMNLNEPSKIEDTSWIKPMK